MTPKILLLYAHPHPRKSRVNEALLTAVIDLENVTVNRLYEAYPDFQIDISHEQSLLLEHDVVVFQHPLYWYSSPAILKEWQDTVLQAGFAYGEKGKALQGKHLQSVITTGSPTDAYQASGLHRFTHEELLRPFEQTAHLCHMQWQTPRVVPHSANIDDAALAKHCADYRDFLQHYSFNGER